MHYSARRESGGAEFGQLNKAQEELASKVWRLFKHRCEKRQVQNVLVYRNMTTDYDRAKKIEFLQPHVLLPRKLIVMIGVIILSLEHDWHRF